MVAPDAVGRDNVAAAEEDHVTRDEEDDVDRVEGAVALDRKLAHQAVLEGRDGRLCRAIGTDEWTGREGRWPLGKDWRVRCE